MSFEPNGSVITWTYRLGSIRWWSLPAAIISLAIVGIHGGIHLLPTPGSHTHLTMQAVSIGLWWLTTLIVIGGLVALGRAYSSLASQLDAEPQLDLGILPKDERRILHPVIDRPGVTQVEVVARSDFSDAKVSQTLKALRERGLVYRERQGRTYRLYPGTVLEDLANDSLSG